MARDAVLVEHRLHFGRVAEGPRRAVPGHQPAGLPPHGHARRARRNARPAPFVAAHAAGRLAGADDRAGAHRLDHHPPLVQKLEVDERVGRHGEVGASVGLDRHRAQDPLVVEVVPGHARGLRAAAVPRLPGPKPLLRRLDHAQVLDRPAGNPLHPGPHVGVGQVEIAVPLGQVGPRGDGRRAVARRQRHRVVAAGGLAVEHHLVAEEVDQADAHLLALAGHARAEEVPLRKRIGVLVLDREVRVAVVVAFADPVDRAGRPRADDGRAAVEPQPAVDDGDRPPRPVVARGERGQQPFGAGDRPVVEHGAGGVRVITPVHGVVGAVGIDGPDALGVAEVAIDVLPAVVDHAAVGQQRRVPLVQRAVADLLDVGPVRLHHEQVAHDVPVAHAELGLPRGSEQDPPVGKVDRVDVGDAAVERELLQARPVGVHLVDVVVVLPVPPHREKDLAPVEADLDVARHALGHLQQRGDLAAPGEVDRLDRPAAREAARVDLARLEHRGRVVVVRAVLTAHHEHQRPAAHQRVGDQGLAAQRLQLGPEPLELLGCGAGGLLPEPIQASQVVAPAGVALAAGRGQVADRRTKRLGAGQVGPRGHAGRDDHQANQRDRRP